MMSQEELVKAFQEADKGIQETVERLLTERGRGGLGLGKTQEENDLILKLYEYEQEYFQDMTLNEGWLAELASIADDMFDYIHTTIEELSEIKIEELDGCSGQYSIKDNTITISPEYKDDKAVILHEMVHYYEENIRLRINPALNETLLLVLYKKLSPLIPDIDKEIEKHADLYYLDDLENSGGQHSILFYLKTLDLDLMCGFPFGTVFGYGYADEKE